MTTLVRCARCGLAVAVALAASLGRIWFRDAIKIVPALVFGYSLNEAVMEHKLKLLQLLNKYTGLFDWTLEKWTEEIKLKMRRIMDYYLALVKSFRKIQLIYGRICFGQHMISMKWIV